MKTASFLFLILVSAGAVQSAYSQPKRVKIATLGPAPAKYYPSYEMHLRLAPAGKMYLSMTSSGDEDGDLGASGLGSLITDLPAGGNKFNSPGKVFPRVKITADPRVSAPSLWNPITLFRRGSNIRLFVPNGHENGGDIEIAVPWEEPEPDVDVKPNPLFLMVRMADDGKLLLNNEPAGSLTDTKVLSERLKEIFKAREDNGVFREGSNEVEKSVMILMPMDSSHTVSELTTVARAIWLTAGDQISLTMDDPMDKMLDIIPLPDTAPTRPKKKRKP